MKIRGICGHIIEGIEILDSSGTEVEHKSLMACPDCENKGNKYCIACNSLTPHTDNKCLVCIKRRGGGGG